MDFPMVAHRHAVRQLISWVSGDDAWDAIRIVTGSPGSGASRLTAWTIMGAGADVRRFVPDVQGLLPPLDVAVDARGKTVREQELTLVKALLPHAAEYGGGLPLVDLARAAEKRGRPFTVALTDTARCGRLVNGGEPSEALERVVLPLATISRAVRRSVKLSRSPVRLLLDLPRAQACELVERADLSDACLIDLDSEAYVPHPGEFREWVEWLLTVRSSLYRSVPESRGRLATVIAERSWPHVLLAEALAIDLRTRNRPVPSSPAELPGHLAQVWLSAVRRAPSSDLLERILAPVVLAQGQLGIPEALCADAAASIIGREVSVPELTNYLRPVSAFLSEEFVARPSSAPDDSPVRHLRLTDTALADAVRQSYGSGGRQAERRIASAVRDRVPSTEAALAEIGEDGLSPEQDYALGAGWGHALASGTVDDWLADPMTVLLSDASAMDEAVRAAGETPPGLAGVRRAVVAEERRLFGGMPAHDLGERAARLRHSAVVRRDHSLADWIDACGVPLPWVTCWARWRPLGAFDPATYDTGWPGPVSLRGWRQSGAGTQFCTQSRFDGSYQWWNLEDGSAAGPTTHEAPRETDFSAVIGGGTPHRTAFTTGPGGEVVLSHGGQVPETVVLPRGQVTEVQPLPDGRALLAGHSGVMLVSLPDRSTGKPRLPAPATQAGSRFLPNPAWWSKDALRAEDVSLLGSILGGPVMTDAARVESLPPLSSDTVKLLTDVGLPSCPMWFEGLEELVPELPTLRDFWAAEGYQADLAEAEFLVFGYVGDESMPVCIDPASGRIMAMNDAGVLRPLNSSLSSFLRCWTVAVWALAFSNERAEGERDEFRAFVRERLREVDTLAMDPDNPAWPRLITDAIYVLE
ncbi:SUKH-4 family immunity protein [Streptomyces chryseus]